MSKVLLVDYENVQGINLSEIHGMDFRVKIFAGSAQSKIPLDLVTSAQALGNRVEWIRIDGNGPNALDFHIAYYLGAYIAKDPGSEYFILSRDKGFDPLIRHASKAKLSCKRILSLAELAPRRRSNKASGEYEKILSNLGKIGKGNRPKNKQRLKQYIKTMLGKSATEEKLNQVISALIASKAILEENGKLAYGKIEPEA